MTTDPQHHEGMVRTDMHCHQCGRGFIAEIDFDTDGNHVVECPHCGHEHCRVIEAGVITSERWDSRFDRVVIEPRRVWKHDSLQMSTSTAAEFIRQRWLNFGR